jgi:lysine 2,3-aminomutase
MEASPSHRFPAPTAIPEGIAPGDWESFAWQMQHRVRDLDDLKAWIEPTADEAQAVGDLARRFRFVITPYYASLMDPHNPHCPIRRQVVPSPLETRDSAGLADPLDEVSHSPVKNVIRVYPDRIAFCVNNECALYCRFCLRKRMVGETGWSMQKREIEIALQWIADNPEIRDVLLTGGDPLVFSDDRLDWLLTRLRAIPHVELIRLGTRLPVTLPYRVTAALCGMLARHHPIWVNTHFNHPKEITQPAAEACQRLAHAGIPVGNQSVLMRGINDSPEIMKDLCEQLVRIRVRPYYCYQAQLLEGTEHFRVPIERGLEIFEAMRGRTSGFAIPRYVLDTPHGKVPLERSSLVERDGDHVVVRAWNGEIWREPNPAH